MRMDQDMHNTVRRLRVDPSIPGIHDIQEVECLPEVDQVVACSNLVRESGPRGPRNTRKAYLVLDMGQGF